LFGCLLLFQPHLLAGRHFRPLSLQPGKRHEGLPLSPVCRRCIVGKKLYCGNLSYNMGSAELEQLFGQFGSVKSAEVISDRDTGRSKGFGFVEMGSDQEAQAAIDGINGTEHDGRTLTVNEARPKTERSGGGGGGGRGGYGGGRGGGGGGKRW
jgi:RNA recognition motif-containing protein